jgi:predicted TIM-barrel fold metal-dependent hydrolase
MILDGHVTIGANREVALGLDELLATMDELGIDRALASPPEWHIPVRNREGNELVAAAAEQSGSRLLPYAVASPWLGREAVEELERARELGACALKLDPGLQGFCLLDGLAEPLIAFAVSSRWPVYVRTGTPPHGLPLQAAELALRFPEGAFLLGRGGATDFGRDGPPALAIAPNLYADTAHIQWPVTHAAARPDERRVFFTSDMPFGDPAVELARVVESPLPDTTREAILGGTLAALLNASL